MSTTQKASFNKTRIAPTPSGFLHIGNVFSVAISAYLAKKHDAKLLLRVDDIDGQRSDKKYIDNIFDTLNFLEIAWNEGPRNAAEFEAEFSQKRRLPLYNKAIEQLHRDGLIYPCDCSRAKLLTSPCDCNQENKQLPLSVLNVNWRLKTNNADVIRTRNYSKPDQENFLPAEMENFIVRKKDGFPSYQLTSVIDDLFYDVDLIVRGEDLLPSTLAQFQLASALKEPGFNNITFYHHLLLKGDEGQKLSKSAGALSIKFLRENGKTSADIYRMIALQIGIDGPIANWEQLGDLIFREV